MADDKTKDELDIRPGPIMQRREPPMDIIATQTISISVHLASIAASLQYFVDVHKREEGK